jgi:hypothetical protein
MAVQDRNAHRDAQLLRKALNIALRVPAAGVDQDEPIYATQPRYNYRVMDLSAYADVVATADLILKAQCVPPLAVVGEPQFGTAAAITFTIEELWQNDLGVLTNVAPDATADFSAAFTVLDGFWGVVLVMLDGAQAQTTLAQAPIMAFATEALALANCPRVPAGQGVVGIMTLQAVGADFIALTTLTNVGTVVIATAPRDGHVVTLPVAAVPSQVNAVLGQQIKDASGTRIIEGKGGVGGDLLVVSARSDGASVLTNGQGSVEYRPFPAQGEGRGDISASQTQAAFVP